ncbi:hypothetical protein Tco_1026600 [Tanacetum coccineum]
MSAGFQAKTSKFCPSRVHSSLRPFSVRVDTMAIVCSGSRDHCTFHLDDPVVCNVTVLPSTGNFNIPCAVDGQSLTKQCSYRISEDAPPSTYIQCTKCPPITASMIIGPSVPSSSPRGGKEIVVSEEKLWVTFCLAILSHG